LGKHHALFSAHRQQLEFLPTVVAPIGAFAPDDYTLTVDLIPLTGSIDASSIHFFSCIGARSSSSLERNSLRIGEVFALL
jgi:hypothetical protein